MYSIPCEESRSSLVDCVSETPSQGGAPLFCESVTFYRNHTL